MTSKLTRERIDLIANFHRAMTLPPSHDEIEELARMALAAMDSEPVAEVLSNRPGNDTSTIDRALPVGTQLYRHAQQPVVPPMQHWEELCRQYPDMSIRDAIIRAAWWNHCRAAMLQAVPLTNEGDIALHNYRTALEGIGHIRRTLEETFGGLHGTHVEPDVLIECKTICDAIYAAYSGSSPVIPDGKSVTASTGIQVIPDGYVMVPKEPTPEILAASYMFAHVDATRESWLAMLAAAPQEVKGE